MLTLLSRQCGLVCSAIRLNSAVAMPSTRRNLSFKEKQKRKLPEPKRFVSQYIARAPLCHQAGLTLLSMNAVHVPVIDVDSARV